VTDRVNGMEGVGAGARQACSVLSLWCARSSAARTAGRCPPWAPWTRLRLYTARRFLASRTPPLRNPPLLLFNLPVTLLYLPPRYIQGSREEVKEVTFDADATQVTTPQ
jgi:hypothetical protein